MASAPDSDQPVLSDSSSVAPISNVEESLSAHMSGKPAQNTDDTKTSNQSSDPAAASTASKTEPSSADTSVGDLTEQESLAAIFRRAQRMHQELKDRGADQDQVREAIKLMTNVYKAVRSSSVFSKNEDVDDVNTADLRYVLCAFYLGDLYMMKSAREERLNAVTAGLAYIKAFLKQCQQLNLLSKQDAEIAARDGKMDGVPPAQQRSEKIARFQATKKLRAQIDVLQARSDASERRQGQTVPKSSNFVQKEVDDDDLEEDDDDDTRRLILCIIQNAVQESLEHQRYGAEETRMLKHMQKMEQERERMQGKAADAAGDSKTNGGRPASGPQRVGAKPKVYHIPGPGMNPIHVPMDGSLPAGALKAHAASASAAAVALPFAQPVNVNDIVATHTANRADIFRDRNVPTMSMDEWIEDQVARGLMPPIQSEQQKRIAAKLAAKREISNVVGRAYNEDEEKLAALEASKQMRQKPPPDEDQEDSDDDDVANSKTYKARQWDNWKDDHEKGAGNKGNRDGLR